MFHFESLCTLLLCSAFNGHGTRRVWIAFNVFFCVSFHWGFWSLEVLMWGISGIWNRIYRHPVVLRAASMAVWTSCCLILKVLRWDTFKTWTVLTNLHWDHCHPYLYRNYWPSIVYTHRWPIAHAYFFLSSFYSLIAVIVVVLSVHLLFLTLYLWIVRELHKSVGLDTLYIFLSLLYGAECIISFMKPNKLFGLTWVIMGCDLLFYLI